MKTKSGKDERARAPTDAIAPQGKPNQKHVPEPPQAASRSPRGVRLWGVAKAKSRALNAVARDLRFLGIPDTVGTLPRRFISNPRVGMAKYCENLARSVIRAQQRKKPVILRVDETSLRDRLKAVVASVACEGPGDPRRR